jgi:hypothetical protein
MPKLKLTYFDAHFERVKNHPGMKAYYTKHGIAG